MKLLTLELGDSVTMRLSLIPAGKFLMGSPGSERGRQDDEGLPPGAWVKGSPQVEVTIKRPFYMGVYEVTVAQYSQFTRDTGQKHDIPRFYDKDFKQTSDHPVTNVSWEDAQAFCVWLSKKTGRSVQLPTESQWEYACRAGSNTRFCFGDDDSALAEYAWFSKHDTDSHDYDWYSESYLESNMMEKQRAKLTTHPVGQKKPNAWGLYDMHGNVWEWCADRYAPYVRPDGKEAAGSAHVLRGGSWGSLATNCRSARRNGQTSGFHPGIRHGFRVTVSAEGAE
ncbi:MAG: formylglycine-generating enzyme family protein [Phycisphaerae bacterium]|nr:formylglycine-generating enzyme family protein [Phycisphaerae bacterium]